MAVDLGRQFLERVVVWPGPQGSGWINLHCHSKNDDPTKNGGKDFVVGWPFKTVDEIINRALWVESTSQFFDVWYCTSQQNTATKNTAGKPKAVRKAANATALKAIWIDCDVKPDDKTGKHYVDPRAALTALLGFARKVGLPEPSAIVDSGGGFHVYWISDVALDPATWRGYAEGLKQLLLAEGILCDTGLTTDNCRILRVPGTTNHKYSPARPVRVLRLGQDYNFEARLSFLNKVLPAQASPPSVGTATSYVSVDPAFGAGAMDPSFSGLTGELGTGIEKPIVLLDPRPIFEQCGFLGHALAVGGADYDNPLWNLSVLCTAFMEDGNDYAHAISSGHAGYAAADTQALFDRKVADRAERNIGYPSCRTIQGAGCKACASCPLFAKGKSPLNIRPPQAPPPVTAAVKPQSATGASLNLPAGYDVGGDGVINWITVNPKTGEDAWVPLFWNVIDSPRAEKDPDVLSFRISHDKGNHLYTGVKFEHLRGQGAEKEWLKARIKPRATAAQIGDFFVAWMARLHDAAVAQTAQAFGWYRDDNGIIKGFAFGGNLYLSDGTTTQSGLTDAALQKRFLPHGQTQPWFDAMSYVSRQKRPELDVVVATAFAAPLMEFTGVVGGMLSAYGESGVGKSFALEIGAAVWGHPKKTKETMFSTQKAVLNRLGHTTGLPCYWDEITNEGAQARVLDVVMQTNTGVEGSRLTAAVDQRDRGSWSTLVSINSNLCFKEFIAYRQNTHAAGLNRVLEYKVEHSPNPVGVVPTHVSDAALNKLSHNYGVIGQLYAAMLAADPALVEKELGGVTAYISKDFGADREDRIWVGICGAIYLGAIYANRIAAKLQQPDIFRTPQLYAFIKQVFKDNAGQRARDAVRPSASSFAEDWLAQYLKDRSNETLWIDDMPVVGGRANTTWHRINPNAPSSHGINVVFCKADKKLRVSKANFKDWCAAKKVSVSEVFMALEKNFGLTEERRVLAAGTVWKTVQERCIVIDCAGHSGLEEALSSDAGLNSDLGASVGIANAGVDTGIVTPDGEGNDVTSNAGDGGGSR